MRRQTAILAILAAASTTGCNKVECGSNTFSDGENCIAFDPNDKTPPVTTISPDGARSRDPLPVMLTLTSDEPARIYFTIDGSDPDPETDPGHRDVATVVGITQGAMIKFLAIDPAGNREAVRVARYETDTSGPAAVSDMQVVMNGTTAHVTWTNPTDADYAGTVVARVSDVIDDYPQPGQPVTAGVLTPSVEVLASGNMTELDDPDRPPGPVRYVTWTYDDLANYSIPVAAAGELALGSLAGTFTFAAGALTVTSPANFELGDSTATLAGSTLTVVVNVKNNTRRYLQNPKLEVVTTTNATFNNTTGTADARAFRTLGPNMLAPGATATTDMVFTLANPNATATINVLLAQHPSMITQRGTARQVTFFDLGSSLEQPVLAMTAPGPGDRVGGRVRPPIVSGGHFLDIPTSHGIERFDLATRLRTNSVSLGDQSAVQALLSTGSELIAMVKHAGRRRSGETSLIKLDEGLRVRATLRLPGSDEEGFARPTLSPDRRTLAVPLIGGVALVDVATMTLIDQDPTTPDLDVVNVGITTSIRSVTFFTNDNFVVVARRTGEAAIVKKTAGVYSATLHQEPPNTKGFATALAPDGRVWIAFGTGIRAYDPVADSISTVAYPNTPDGLGVVDGAVWIPRSELNAGRGDKIDQVAANGTVVRTINATAFAGARGHWLGIAP
jgi:hypothetical protein